MLIRFFIGALLLLTVAACGKGSTKFNPFVDYAKGGKGFGVVTITTTGGIPMTLSCDYKNDAGECMKSSCKKDADSNCAAFAQACINYPAYYQGSADGGSCSKIL